MSTKPRMFSPQQRTSVFLLTHQSVPDSVSQKAESSDEENAQHSRSHIRGKNQDAHAKQDELDVSSLPDPDQATRRFRRAEHSELCSNLSGMLIAFLNIPRTTPTTYPIYLPSLTNIIWPFLSRARIRAHSIFEFRELSLASPTPPES